jgi:energy-coupling factor transporter ATP-binding protein EcfA2
MTLVLVTHDRSIAQRASRTIQMQDRRVLSDRESTQVWKNKSSLGVARCKPSQSLCRFMICQKFSNTLRNLSWKLPSAIASPR